MSNKHLADEWLQVALKEIRARIRQLKVEDTGALYRELDGSIQSAAAGDAVRAEILYNYYGLFQDMGVGKGQAFGDQAANKLAGGGRKRKPWTKSISHQSHRLGELLQQEMAKQGVENISGSLLKRIVLEM